MPDMAIADRLEWLATGSMDQTVCLWKVSLASSSGLAVEPALTLTTVPTHILCLHWRRSPSGRSSFLFAGTNMGSVCVWQLDDQRLLAPREERFGAEDGLHSHVQTSDDPIIHLTSICPSDGSESELDLVLVASDNHCNVHVHLMARQDPEGKGEDRPSFFLASSEAFQSAVVGCGFGFNQSSASDSRLLICLMEGLLVPRSLEDLSPRYETPLHGQRGHRDRDNSTDQPQGRLRQRRVEEELSRMEAMSRDILSQMWRPPLPGELDVNRLVAGSGPHSHQKDKKEDKDHDQDEGRESGCGNEDDEELLPRASIPSPTRHSREVLHNQNQNQSQSQNPHQQATSSGDSTRTAQLESRGPQVPSTRSADAPARAASRFGPSNKAPTSSSINESKWIEGEDSQDSIDSTVQDHMTQHRLRVQDMTSLRPRQYHDPIPSSSNPYSRPTLHSAKVFHQFIRLTIITLLSTDSSSRKPWTPSQRK